MKLLAAPASFLFKSCYFLGSYAPLFLIGSVVFWLDGRTSYLIACLSMSIIGCVAFGILLYYAYHVPTSERYEVTTVAREDSQILSYIATYLIPFVTIFEKNPSTSQIVAFSLFFLLFMTIYVLSNVIWANPLLTLFGYHLYRITLSNGNDFTLISKESSISTGFAEYVQIGETLIKTKGTS